MQNRPKAQESTPSESNMMNGRTSKGGVFAQPTNELPKKDSPSTSAESEVSFGGCPACGMMSFSSNAPRHK